MKLPVTGFTLAVALTSSAISALALAGAAPGAAMEQAPAAKSQAGHAQNRSAGRVLEDVTITGKVKTALMQDKGVSANEINVDTVDGIVQLKGNVDSKAEAQRALILARRVDGVKKVKSFLKIVPNEKTASGAGRSPGQVVSDVTTTAKVKTALMEDKVVPANTINVDTVNGIVQLKGKVPSKAAAQRAVAVARKAAGTKGVKSFLQVAPQEKTAGYRSESKAKTHP